jgi:hypothetical protein
MHNFPLFVTAAGLFASTLTEDQRSLFSPAFTQLRFNLDDVVKKASEAGEVAMKRHASILSRTNGNDAYGIFRFREDKKNSGNRLEQRLSMCFTSALSQFISSLGSDAAALLFGAREQLDDARNSQDFVLNRVLKAGTLPAAIIEFAVDKGAHDDHKEAQLFTYVLNNMHSLPANKSIFTLGVSFLDLAAHVPSFQVFGYYDIDGEQYGVVPITERTKVTAKSLANMFYALTEFALALNLDALPSSDEHLPFPDVSTGGVCFLADGRIRAKVLNYINFYPLRIDNGGRGGIPDEARRTHMHSLAMLPGCTHVSSGYGLDIIIWPNIDGDHEPHHSNCVAACIDHLDSAHTRGVWHCDLHLGNFIFNQDHPELSCLIDWDHSRFSAAPGCYVEGWQPLFERHPGATPQRNIKLEHERYSLGKVMERFEPDCNNDDIAERWRGVCTRAADIEVAVQLIAEEVRSMECELRLVSRVGGIVVTGSPSRVAVRTQRLSNVVEEETE